MKYRKREVLIPLVMLFTLFLMGGVFKAYVIAGVSDSPTHVLNEKVLVNRCAYDLNMPYTTYRIASISNPERGDMILFKKQSGNPGVVLKRVVGIPGDTIEMKDNHLVINGKPLEYQSAESEIFDNIPGNACLGSIVEIENGIGDEHYITYTPKKSELSSFGPVEIKSGQYYVLGENRDNSLDSRTHGTISRDEIYGKLLCTIYRP